MNTDSRIISIKIKTNTFIVAQGIGSISFVFRKNEKNHIKEMAQSILSFYSMLNTIHFTKQHSKSK